MQRNPKDIYREAAVAAKAEIPEKELEIRRLMTDIDKLQRELGRLRVMASYIEEGEDIPRLGVQVMDQDRSDSMYGSREKVPRGVAARHIDVLLSDGTSRSPQQIKDEIEQRFRIAIPMSTIYLNLSRGRAEGRFETDIEDRWTVAKDVIDK